MTVPPPGANAAKDDYYAAFLSSPGYRANRARKAAVVATVIEDEIRSARMIGDLGSGTGLLKRALEEISGKPVFGFEIDREVVIERERTCVADGARLPVRDGSFDLLIVNHVYEHVADPGRLFEEVSRVLRPGGRAYVTAGSRWALVEPHYRLPFLSWLPARLADWYLRCSGRGRRYEGIRFLGYRPLRRVLDVEGTEVTDITDRAIRAAIGSASGSGWRAAWGLLSLLPETLRRRALRWSPQWFFLMTRRK